MDSGGGDGGGSDGGGGMLVIEPAGDQMLRVVMGEAVPTLTYTATYNGTPVPASWTVDRDEVATVSAELADSTVFSPTAEVGGVVTITAMYQGLQIQGKVSVALEASQNGPNDTEEEQAQIPTDVPDLDMGGGVGGVGGEGLGVPVSDGPITAALDNPGETGEAQGLRFLYPYDGTVWPRGLPAPLLQWDWSVGDADAIKIEMLTSTGSFVYSGTFGRPAILAQTGGNFIRHPIPQNAWDTATNTAGGTDLLTVRVTVASGGVGHGPIEQTYKIASARLAGTIYYQSYGTNLAKNYTGAVGGDGQFGGAVLSIKVGDLAPQLAAGASGAPSNCRVCHSVAANGSRLIAQTSSPSTATFASAITPGMITEEALSNHASFPGLSPDGKYALSHTGQLLDLDSGGAIAVTTGLDEVSTLGTPSFSPAGDKVVFNPMAGSGVQSPANAIAVMDFDQQALTFSNYREVHDTSAEPEETRPGWAAFFPDGNGIVYQQQIAAGFDGNNHGDLRTRKGAKAYLAWTLADGTGTPTPLDNANGAGYLPSLASPDALACTGDGTPVGGLDADHADDVNLNYEPTVNPVATGGYAWVVFTSRRMYGNTAAIPPFCSDPRGVDLIENITTKKLWVAAVDLNAPSGTDPSHPAFYLPSQELLAGNARGFWVFDPCRGDGDTCETGDQCCGGYCGGTDDVLVCSSTPNNECSMTQEACETADDCCSEADSCINNFCAQIVID